MTATTYWRAHEVDEIVEQLLHEHHDHLNRHDIKIVSVFREPVTRAHGRIVLGKARKVGGLNAHLVGLVRKDALDGPADFFVVEVAHQPWQHLTNRQKLALVDHELCHFDVEIPEHPDNDRKLIVRGHDLEEFTDVVKRHGLWRPEVEHFARTANNQLALDVRSEDPA